MCHISRAVLLSACAGVGAVQVRAGVAVQSTSERIANADVRRFLERSTQTGPMVHHPNYSQFPVKGVYIFQGLGPAALEDFSYARDWDERSNSFVLDMNHTILQSGLDSKHGGIGPHVPGTWLENTLYGPMLSYKVFFRCPQGPILNEDKCEIDSSFRGADFKRDPTGTQYFIKHQNGRLFERSSTMFGLEVHKYYLRRVVDELGQVDEDNFDMLMEKLDGQDLIVRH